MGLFFALAIIILALLKIASPLQITLCKDVENSGISFYSRLGDCLLPPQNTSAAIVASLLERRSLRVSFFGESAIPAMWDFDRMNLSEPLGFALHQTWFPVAHSTPLSCSMNVTASRPANSSWCSSCSQQFNMHELSLNPENQEIWNNLVGQDTDLVVFGSNSSASFETIGKLARDYWLKHGTIFVLIVRGELSSYIRHLHKHSNILLINGTHEVAEPSTCFPGDERRRQILNKIILHQVGSIRNIKNPRLMVPSQEDFMPATLSRMVAVLKGCGEVCNTSAVGVPSLYFPEIRKRVNCPGLLLNTAIDESRPIGPAPQMPHEMKPFFSYDGRVPVVPYSAPGYSPGFLFNQQYMGGVAKSAIWEYGVVEAWKKDCALGKLEGNYGAEETKSVFEGMTRMGSLVGGHVLVIGSENPWVEACALAAGASMITTLEYGNITSLHPQIRTTTPPTMRRKYQDKTLPVFDAVVTFSSVEHSGLGRYGDALNPWGDLQGIARAWCITKPQGELLIGVPTEKGQVDRIEFNAHRVYGPVMFSHLLANWKQKWRASNGSQLVHVLERMDPV